MRCSNVPPFLFHSSTTSCPTIRCSTVQPSDILLFHHHMFYCSIMTVPLLHYQMFTISSWLFPCSTNRYCVVLPWLFNCSTIKWSTVPPSLFNCSTIGCSTVPSWLFHRSNIRCSTVPHLDVPMLHYQSGNITLIIIITRIWQGVLTLAVLMLLWWYWGT